MTATKNDFEEPSESELAAQQGREGNHPFELGRQAALDGQALGANPFARRSVASKQFQNGWNAGVAEKSKQAATESAAQPADDEAPANPKYKTKARYVQGDLPGTEEGKPQFDEAVDQAARAYAEARDARMAANKVEKECKDFLIELLGKKEMTGYKFEDVEIELVTGEVKLKVRIKDDGSEEEGDE